ncbi:hypothetical protein CRYUN_Cryun19dG0095600 [Craigia yunnanensis]
MFVLSLRKNDKCGILHPYLQHILSVADDIDQRKKEIKLCINVESPVRMDGGDRSRSIIQRLLILLSWMLI